MNVKDKITRWFQGDLPAYSSHMATQVEQARKARFAGDYDRAVQLLDNIHQHVDADPLSEFALIFRKAEVLLDAERIDEAKQALGQLKALAALLLEGFPKTYAEIMAGLVANAEGDTTNARLHFEEAQQIAHHAGIISGEGRASCQLAQLALQEGNAAYAITLLQTALPKLNSNSDIEASVYFLGLYGQALIQEGREAEGRKAFGRALQLAEHLQYRKYEYLWSVELGTFALNEGRYFDASTHLERALKDYQSQPPSPDISRAFLRLSEAFRLRGEPELSRTPVKIALAMASQLEDADLKRRARFEQALIHYATQEYPQAIEHLQSILGEDESQNLEALRWIGAASSALGQTAEAMQYYQRGLSYIREHNTLGCLDKTEALFQRDLGLIYMRSRQFNEAISVWTRAVTLFEADNNYSQVSRLLTDLANIRRFMGQTSRAMKDTERALELMSRVPEYDIETRGLVLSNAANVFAEHGDIESAEAFFTQSMQFATSLESLEQAGARNNNWAWVLILLGRPRRAIAVLEPALRESQEAGLTLLNSIQTDNLGLAYDALSEHETARQYHEKALEQITPLNQPFWEAQFKANLALTLLSLKEAETALVYAEEALQGARVHGSINLYAQTLIALARVCIHLDQLEKAETLISEALHTVRRAESRRMQAEAASAESELRGAQGRLEEAQTAWDSAVHFYTILHSPQAKAIPAWLKKASS